MTPTPEQTAILTFARDRSENLLVNALAGTGKTSTIEMVCSQLTTIPILYLAFNKRIVDEATKRMPGHVECRTQNSLGHRVWSAAVGRRLVVDAGKSREILRGLIKALPQRQQGVAWDNFSDTLKLIARCKREGYVPPAWNGPCKPITQDLKEILDDEDPSLCDEVLLESIRESYNGRIDYDDQIYMPVIFGGSWPRFPLVIIDEAQDWSPLGHHMLEKLITKRFIAVGDPWQSIYAFRGAVTNGMQALAVRYAMEQLPLSMTFRVPKRGVERAQEHVSHYVAHPANPEGEVVQLDDWGPESIPAEAAIICRNNAPLISLAFKLLRDRRAIKLVGMDIGAGLVKILKKLGPSDLKGEALSAAINQWEAKAVASGKKPETVYDRADCLRALCEGKENLYTACLMAEELFKREGPIQLLSGHKCKGMEYETVFHLDPWRIPSRFAREGSEEWEQELNVRYVIETRFKGTMYLCDLQHYQGEF